MLSDRVRVALLDDETLFRSAFALALRHEGFDVVVEGADARESFPKIDASAPDVAVLELSLPTMDGVTAIRELRARRPEMGLFVLTRCDSPRLLMQARDAGAQGFATKRNDMDVVLDGIRRVATRELFIAPGVMLDEDVDEHSPMSLLSVRERDVFRLVVRGLKNGEIARQLCISSKTVDTHRSRIMKKLDVHSAVQLLRVAAAHGLLDG